ncbi:DUF5994 family protein [Nonomuraea endophytica]|uniref:DUF5994 family protein n=1 Tax=Nonomuraea endophytica TaxID=714136 RepID=UPI0037CBCBB0
MLNPALDRRAVVDGAWWPYSRDAAAELPALIAAVDRMLDRVTLRVDVHVDAWKNLPRHIPARGRRVRVGWFHHSDPRVVILSFAAAGQVVLLLVPSTAPVLTAQNINGLTTEDILTLAHLAPDLGPSPKRRLP